MYFMKNGNYEWAQWVSSLLSCQWKLVIYTYIRQRLKGRACALSCSVQCTLARRILQRKLLEDRAGDAWAKQDSSRRTAESEEQQKKGARGQGTLEAMRMASRTGKLKIGTPKGWFICSCTWKNDSHSESTSHSDHHYYSASHHDSHSKFHSC